MQVADEEDIDVMTNRILASPWYVSNPLNIYDSKGIIHAFAVQNRARKFQAE